MRVETFFVNVRFVNSTTIISVLENKSVDLEKISNKPGPKLRLTAAKCHVSMISNERVYI